MQKYKSVKCIVSEGYRTSINMHYILKLKKIELLSEVVWFFLKTKHCMVFISFYMFCFVKLASTSGLNSPSWLPDIHKGAITGPRANGDGRNGELMRGWWMTDDSRGGMGKGSELIFGWILSSEYSHAKQDGRYVVMYYSQAQCLCFCLWYNLPCRGSRRVCSGMW